VFIPIYDINLNTDVVVQDGVSRKISLDTVVNFALEEGSQWIFITPHYTRSIFVLEVGHVSAQFSSSASFLIFEQSRLILLLPLALSLDPKSKQPKLLL
jgi:hypothetical protein